MKTITPITALLLLCLNLSYAQTYEVIDRIDWSQFADNTLSGNSENGQPWSAILADDCDATGFFGADQSASTFKIEDTEGSCGCPCVPADPGGNCGRNNNTIGVSLLSNNPFQYCETRVRFTITGTGVMCGMNDDETAHPVGICPLDPSFSGTDAMNITIIGNDLNDIVTIDICGMIGANQEYVIDLGNSIFSQISFIGGTQENGESYQISDIVFEGKRTDLPPILNLFDLTSEDGKICENSAQPIILQTLADGTIPGMTFNWSGPNGFTSQTSSPTIQTISTANSGTYSVTVTDANGCQLTDQLDIEVLDGAAATCTVTPNFELFMTLCSSDTLPNISLNGIPGTWSPGNILAGFAGETRNFTFDPDNQNVDDFVMEIEVDDISRLLDFGIQPAQIPVFCNAASETIDFIQTFQLNLDLLLRINGDSEVFSFIPNNTFANNFEAQLRALSFANATPGSYNFFIEAVSPCGQTNIISFSYVVVDADVPLQIDTTICSGDFVEIAGEIFDISRSSGTISTPGCGADINVSVFFQTGDLEDFGIEGACGQFYFYDTTINGIYIGPTPNDLGDFYLEKWESSFDGTFQLNTLSANGCPKTGKIFVGIDVPRSSSINFDLCADLDTFVTILGTTRQLNVDNPIRTFGSDCDSVVIVTANILPVVVTEVTKSFCADQDTTINGILFNRDHPSEIIRLEEGDNGCKASIVVDLEFIEPQMGFVDARLCPGDFIIVGSHVIASSMVNELITLPRAASTGCDSTIIVNVEIVTPESRQEARTICPEDQFFFLGQTYDVNNSFGFPTIQSSLGCDSIIYSVNISFHDVTPVVLNPTLCFGESMDFPEFGITLDADYLTDTVGISTIDGCMQELYIQASMRAQNVADFTPEVCQGSSIIVNATRYDETNTTGIEIFQDINGCDSIVNVNLTILPVKESTLNMDLCSGGDFIFNGTIYNETNPTGTEQFTTADGCDSNVIVTINTLAVKESTLNMDLCSGGDFIFNGTTYNETNPTGTEQFTTADGCDSNVIVTINTLAVKSTAINEVLCDGGSMIVNGVTYDQLNPSGSESFLTSEGCDSTVNIDLSFQIAQVVDIDTMLCPETSIMLGGEIFGGVAENRSITISSLLGCDSLIFNINVGIITTEPIIVDPILCFNEVYEDPSLGLTIDANSLTQNFDIINTDGCVQNIIVQATMREEIIVDLPVQLCQGTSTLINGITYDVNNLTGSTTLTTSSGCDSTVNVQIEVTTVINTQVDRTLCTGESITVNGTKYDESNLTGSEQFSTADGCDSIVTVNLTFVQPMMTSIVELLCESESILINGSIYDINNPQGTEVLMTTDGCDSTVTIDLSFTRVRTELFDNTLCESETIDIHGTTYGASNPSERDTIKNGNGCDSIIVEVDLTINTITESFITGARCDDFMIVVNGNTYDINNRQGVETITNGNANGCDSIVNIDLQFQSMIFTDFVTTICKDGSVTVGGEVFDINMPAGSVTLMSTGGCDSIIDVTLSFFEFNITTQDIIGSCDGVANGSFTIQNISGATPPFSLTGSDGSSTTITDNGPFTVDGLAAGNYTYTAIDANGCTESFEIVITDDRQNALSLSVTERDEQLLLNIIFAGDIESIVWDNTSGLSCYNCTDPIATIDEETVFTVTVTDVEGCVSTTSIRLSPGGIPAVYIPNIFSTSSFAGNDRFFVQGPIGLNAFVDMQVFDRWGSKMFEVRNAPISTEEFGWDGRYNGNTISPGVYIYTARIFDGEGAERRFSGDVTFIK